MYVASAHFNCLLVAVAVTNFDFDRIFRSLPEEQLHEDFRVAPPNLLEFTQYVNGKLTQFLGKHNISIQR